MTTSLEPPSLTGRQTAVRYALTLLVTALAVASQAGEWAAPWPVDLAAGIVALALSTQRRRWPLPIAVAAVALTTVSAFATGPALLSAVSLATHRRVWQVALVFATLFASNEVHLLLAGGQTDMPRWAAMLLNGAYSFLVVGCGMYIGSRRALSASERDRAELTVAERVRSARQDERARIAREMHDVLAHRISKVSMTAAALVYRDDLDADEMRSRAAVIQQQANTALAELRGVLGVLRDGTSPDPAGAPQPTFADVAALLADGRLDGVRIDERLAVDGELPEATGRTVFRVVQEGLTNARKHSPEAAVDVSVVGSQARGVEVVVSNPLPFGVAADRTEVPGAGLGLIGLAERVELAGGRLEHGAELGRFVLRAWLPWSV